MANTAVKNETEKIEVVNMMPLTMWRLKVEELNKKRISSPKEAIEILKELNSIKGKIIEGSVLEISLKNLGIKSTNDINQIIGDLTEKKSDKTSVVDEGKIKELVEEYEKYLNDGLDEEEALNKIKKENNDNFSIKEIEDFIRRQKELYDETRKAISNDDDEIIENKSDEVTKKIIKELNNNERFEELIERKKPNIEKDLKETVKKVFSGEETTIENGIIKIIQEKDDSFINQKIPINRSSIKSIQLELNDWINKNEKQILNYKGKVLEKKIKTEILKKDPELREEKKEDIENYIKFVKTFYYSTKVVNIDKYKEKSVNKAENVNLSPGQINNGWDNLQAFSGLINSTQKPLELLDQYGTLIKKIGNKIPFGIKECDSLNVIMRMTEKSDDFRHLVEKTQNILNWKGNLVSSLASKLGLDKFVANVTGKVLGEEFVKNSLVILSQKSLEQGSFIILQSFIGGGTSALAVTAATITMETATAAAAAATAALETATISFNLANTAAAAAIGTAAEASTAAALQAATAALATATETAATTTAAATAANAALAATTKAAGTVATKIGTMAATGAVPVVGWVITALMAISTIFKPVFDKIKDFLSDIGLNFTKGIKKFLEENLGLIGKFGSFVINLAEDLIITAGSIFAITTIGPIVLILVLIFGGLIGYSTYQDSFISSLAPPKGSNSTNEIIQTSGETLPVVDSSVPEGCPSGWPAISGDITQGPLGSYSHSTQQAIDIVIKGDNFHVYATSTGTVSYTSLSSCGLGINIASSCNGQRVTAVYCHLAYRNVASGQTVKKGDYIGIEGSTGAASGRHLHYELVHINNINDYLPQKVPAECYYCISF